jgi:hypothetical protein
LLCSRKEPTSLSRRPFFESFLDTTHNTQPLATSYCGSVCAALADSARARLGLGELAPSTCAAPPAVRTRHFSHDHRAGLCIEGPAAGFAAGLRSRWNRAAVALAARPVRAPFVGYWACGNPLPARSGSPFSQCLLRPSGTSASTKQGMTSRGSCPRSLESFLAW